MNVRSSAAGSNPERKQANALGATRPARRARSARVASRLVLLLLAAGMVGGCAPRETPVQKGIRDQILHRGNSTEPESLDPHLVRGAVEWRLVGSLFEGLTDQQTLEPRPGGAERWSVSADGLTYTFHLRRDARWSDATAGTAEDFVYAARRLLAPRLGASHAENTLFFVKNAQVQECAVWNHGLRVPRGLMSRDHLELPPGVRAACERLRLEILNANAKERPKFPRRLERLVHPDIASRVASVSAVNAAAGLLTRLGFLVVREDRTLDPRTAASVASERQRLLWPLRRASANSRC